ncbi:MAG: CYCXC family (seleno)protein [Terriglobales bacterium]
MRTRFFASAVLFLLVTMVSAPWLQSESDEEIPHFNAGPPAKGVELPPILTKDQLFGPNAQHAYQTHAYELAAKIPQILYQQPCFCYCDRGMGHTSLHSCYAGTHGAECGTCQKELYYTYMMYKRHKTARQIREGIIKGEWKTIDLAKAASME